MRILITGISKGLGFALASAYASAGHTVAGLSRSRPLGLPGSVTWTPCDLIDEGAIGGAVETSLAGMPHLDLLINNAGRGSRGARLGEVDAGEVRDQIALHCLGALRVAQAALPKLRASPAPRIVNVTSRLGSVARHARGDFVGRDFSYGYRIAKAAQNMLTTCMQGDPSLAGIVIAALNPGLLLTDSGASDATRSADEGARAVIASIERMTASGSYHAFGEDTLL